MGGGEEVEVRIWTDTCRAVDQGLAVASWLRTVLDMVRTELFLVHDLFRVFHLELRNVSGWQGGKEERMSAIYPGGR